MYLLLTKWLRNVKRCGFNWKVLKSLLDPASLKIKLKPDAIYELKSTLSS